MNRTLPIVLAVAAYLAVPAVAALPSGAAAEPPAISLDTMKQRAQSGLGYSYWWGGGRWDPSSKSCLGGCTGSCGACTHRPARSRNGAYASSCPEYGADCSGYVANVWIVSESYRDLKRSSHGPYPAASFRASNSIWYPVSSSSTKPGDARATSTHIYFVWDRSPGGTIASTEAVGCSYGIIRGRRSTGDGYTTSHRRNFSTRPEDREPRKAARPVGPTSGREGDRLHFCSSARDPDKDKVGLKFVFEGGGKKQAKKTRMSKSGNQMCVTWSPTRSGTFKVYAVAFDKVRKNGKVVDQFGPRSEVLKVKIGDDAARDARAPAPKRPVSDATVPSLSPWFEFTEIDGPPTSGSTRANLRYDLEVYDRNPRAAGNESLRPVFKTDLAVGPDLVERRGRLRWDPAARLGDFLPRGNTRYYWRVRACHWGDCTPWSSSIGRKRYATFRTADVGGGGGGECLGNIPLPRSCQGVAGTRVECASASQCGGAEDCVVTVQGAACAEPCADDGDCALGTRCLPAVNGQGTVQNHCLDPSPAGETCACDLLDAYAPCGGRPPETDPNDPRLFARVYGCN